MQWQDQIHLHWVPGHQGIYSNEKADEAAKYGAEWCNFTDRVLNLVTDKTIYDHGKRWRRGLRAARSWSWRSPWILRPTRFGLTI